MIRVRLLADGVTEIRLVDDDGAVEAIVELTRPAYHALLISYLMRWQEDCRRLEAVQPVECVVLAFPAPTSEASA